MQLKVCGVRSLDMYQICKELGVDFVGINFVPTSHRKVSLDFCKAIAQTSEIPKVGIFQNQTEAEIMEAVNLAQLNIVQLHGTETPEFIDNLKAKLPEIQFWKAFSIDETFQIDLLQRYGKNCDLFLFDGKFPGSGTLILDNKILDEACKKSKKLKIPYGIAGGVAAQNIPKFKSRFPKAALLDTASGVEIDGIFDPARCRALINNFHNYA